MISINEIMEYQNVSWEEEVLLKILTDWDREP